MAMRDRGRNIPARRLERYLQLAAQENWRVANCSTSAQYFHLLRTQAYSLKSNPRPLIVFTPKSLLRHPSSSTTLTALTEGHFQSVIDDEQALARATSIRRLLLTTGKISIELLTQERRAQAEDTAIARVELLYPFPADELEQVMANYPNLRELIWVQEEPENMGAWSYMAPHLTKLLKPEIQLHVIARPERSSPAVGFIELHSAEQEQILAEALSTSISEHGGKYVR